MNLVNAFLNRGENEDDEPGEIGSKENPIVSRSGKERRKMRRRVGRIRNKFARQSQRDYLRELKAKAGYPAGVSFLIGRTDPPVVTIGKLKGRSKYGARRDVKEYQRESDLAASAPVELVSPS